MMPSLAVAVLACSSSALGLGATGTAPRPVLDPFKAYDAGVRATEWAAANSAVVASAEQAALNAIPDRVKQMWEDASPYEQNKVNSDFIQALAASAGRVSPACCGGCTCCGTGDNGYTGKNCPSPGVYTVGQSIGLNAACAVFPDCPFDRNNIEGSFCCPRE